ncbi:dihydroxyacetone kinase [Acidipropionibacterium jensenii]|uniref:dihydroxyacetone kinase phosphoryl donor subunit DhaM n=1 Tax=Acidipropionibacterium jensenii TaxID=1749 RepID=UPI00110A3281|nr:dihydroxyacetone kinase phosphoryl donor subunit DhaM [Acidipropionibacterium jensenii]QCV88234.1 dihydroxyacetone kinase [Acidipropionibacterium jensenii]
MTSAQQSPAPTGVGIVVVSHSRPLARAAVELAEQMVPTSRPPMRIAAGLDENTLGTDATAVSAALEELSECSGVLVMVDLGSSILSAEMALELVDPELAAKVRVSPGPLVEGLVVAVVTASTGADLDSVADQTARALEPKIQQLAG